MSHRRLSGRVVIATHNPGKLKEMRELLAPYGIEAIAADALNLLEPEETGDSFSANARIKAQAATKAAGLPAFADDSGLTVEALGGEPGIHSARWAGPDKDFAIGPELAFRFNSMPNAEFVVRTHHRSGAQGTLGRLHEGHNASTFGVRFPF